MNRNTNSESILNRFPDEILRKILISAGRIDPIDVEVQHTNGAWRNYPRRSVLATCRDVHAKCNERKFILITYNGDQRYSPTMYVPIAGSSHHKRIVRANDNEGGSAFVFWLAMEHETHDGDAQKEQVTCAMTVNAACTWLAILACMQMADIVCHGSSTSHHINLEVNDKKVLDFANGRLVCRAIGVLPHRSVKLEKITQPEEMEIQACIDKSHCDAEAWVRCTRIYSAWISRSLTLGVFPSLAKNIESHADYCAYLCKLLLCANRTVASQTKVIRYEENAKLELTQRAAAAILSWAYEFERDAYEEGSLLQELRGQWYEQKTSTCDVPGCPCLFWTALGCVGGPVVSYNNVKKHGVGHSVWLAINRRAVLVHCRSRIPEGADNALRNASEQMLHIKNDMMSINMHSEDFNEDFNTFDTANTLGVQHLANQHNINMPNMESETILNMLDGALTLVDNERQGEMERRFLGDAALPARNEGPLGHFFESEIVPVTELLKL